MAGVCLALFFSFMFACGYVVVYGHNQLRFKFALSVAVVALAGTALHIAIAEEMGWNALFPANGKGLLLVVYYLDVFLWGGIFSYLVMRKFPKTANRIISVAIGKS